jgi:hypothetical protein
MFPEILYYSLKVRMVSRRALRRGLLLRPQGEGLLLQLGPRGKEHAGIILLTTTAGKVTVVAEQAGGLVLEPLEDEAPRRAGGAVHWCSSSGVLYGLVHCCNTAPGGRPPPATSPTRCLSSSVAGGSTSGPASYFCVVG